MVQFESRSWQRHIPARANRDRDMRSSSTQRRVLFRSNNRREEIMARIARRRASDTVCSGGLAAILATGRAPASPRRRPSTGCAGPISCRPRTRCSRARSRRNARRRPASSSRSRPSTPTICRRASPRRSSRAPAPTSSWRSATGRSSTPKAWPTSSDVAEEIGKAQGGYYDVSKQSPRSAANGSACRGRSAAG